MPEKIEHSFDTIEISGLERAFAERAEKNKPVQTDSNTDSNSQDASNSSIDDLKAKINNLEGMVTTLVGALQKAPTAPAPENHENTAAKVNIAEDLLGPLKEALKDLPEDEKLTPNQAKSVAAQVGEIIIPQLVDKLEKVYGERLNILSENIKKTSSTTRDTAKQAADSKFLSEFPFAGKPEAIAAINDKLKQDPSWNTALESGEAGRIYDKYKEKFAVCVLEGRIKVPTTASADAQRQKEEARRTASRISTLGSEPDNTGKFKQKSETKPSIRERLIENLHSALESEGA